MNEEKEKSGTKNMKVVQMENGVLIKLSGKEEVWEKTVRKRWEGDERNADKLKILSAKNGEYWNFIRRVDQLIRFRLITVQKIREYMKTKKLDPCKKEKKIVYETAKKVIDEVETTVRESSDFVTEEEIFEIRIARAEELNKMAETSKIDAKKKMEEFRKKIMAFNPNYESTTYINVCPFFKDVPIEASEFESLTPRYYNHGFIDILHKAFMNHLPIEISPDNIWLMILQGISHHQEVTNSLGDIFPFPEVGNKEEIEIRADHFEKGAETNDWSQVFDQFEKGVRDRVPETLYNLLSNKKFSTTTRLDQICYTVTLMRTLQKWFSYHVSTMCGIFEIHVTGELKDWQDLYQHTESIKNSGIKGLEDWFPIILDVIDQFIKVFKMAAVQYEDQMTTIKDEHELFWRSIYKWGERSGGPEISGWICTLFPYTTTKNWRMKTFKLQKASWREGLQGYMSRSEDYSNNLWVDYFKSRDDGYFREGLKPSDVPNGICCVPFMWKTDRGGGLVEEYCFYAGFLGSEQKKDGSYTLKTKVGYAVGKKLVEEEEEEGEEGR